MGNPIFLKGLVKGDTMSYSKSRKEFIKNQVENLATTYANNIKKDDRTIILLPGSPGSELWRTRKPYPDSSNNYLRVWVDSDAIIAKSLDYLVMDENEEDEKQHYIFPQGALTLPENTYDETGDYLAKTLGGRNKKHVKVFTFAYDWRRSVDDSAALLQVFLLKFKEVSLKNRDYDPLPKTTLLCHSFGGLVALYFLQNLKNKNPFVGDDTSFLHSIITVATPYLGVSEQLRRNYHGNEIFNIFYGVEAMNRLIASFPGTYLANYLSKDDYDNYKEVYAKRGESIELANYPTTDAVTGQPLDFFSSSAKKRLPGWVNTKYINRARRHKKEILEPLPEFFKDRVFNIRSVGIDMGAEQVWQEIDGSKYKSIDYDQANPSTISYKQGKGDNSVPFWSARHPHIPIGQVFDIDHKKADHMRLLEHKNVLETAASIIEDNPTPFNDPARNRSLLTGSRMISDPALAAFIAAVPANPSVAANPQLAEDELWRRLLNKSPLV